MEEVQRKNDFTVRSSINQHSELTNETEMCKGFQEHLGQLCGGSDGPECKRGLTKILTEIQRLSNRDSVCCDGPITHEKVVKSMADCGVVKAPGLYGLPYEL